MFDKLIESALAQYMPSLSKMTEAKRAELAEMRAKVRTRPEEVELWFDREIEKLADSSIKSLIHDLKEKGPPSPSSMPLGTESSK